MNPLREWIEPDLKAELERLDEARRQVREQRNLTQFNRTREIRKYSKLKAEAKARYFAEVKAKRKPCPVLESVPKSEHCKQSYHKTLVKPIDWTPPTHIQSPVRDTKHNVQIIQLTSEVIAGKPFNAIVSDGNVSIPTLFKPCNGLYSYASSIREGTIIQITRYIFRFPGSCSKSWEEGLTRNDQLKLSRSTNRKPKRPKSLKYPSIAASIGEYRPENNFLPADGLLLEVDISKVLQTKALCSQAPPSLEENWELMDIVNQFPVLPIRIPGLDLWCTEIIAKLARIWYIERAWQRFSQSMSHMGFREVQDIKSTFLQLFQANDKTMARVVKRARRNVFESMYCKEGSIGSLFDIRLAYKNLQSLLKNEPQSLEPSQYSHGFSATQQRTKEGRVGNFQSDDEMLGTQFATQFPPSSSKRGKEVGSTPGLEKRIARFQYDLDPVEYENFNEIVRTLYSKASDSEFNYRAGVTIVYGHISDFYAAKILAKVAIAQVKPQKLIVQRRRPIGTTREIKIKKELVREVEPPEKPPSPPKIPIVPPKKTIRPESSRKETKVLPPQARPGGREQLEAALARVKKATLAAEQAHGTQRSTTLEAPRNPSPYDTPAIPLPHADAHNKHSQKVVRKTSTNSFSGQEHTKAPATRPSAPLPAGDPMEGVITEPKRLETSRELQSNRSKPNIRHSVPILSEELGIQGIKPSQDKSYTKRQGSVRPSQPAVAAEHPSQAPAPLVSRSPIVLSSTPQSSQRPAPKHRLEETGKPPVRKTLTQNASKPPAPDTEQNVPIPVKVKLEGVEPPSTQAEKEPERVHSVPQQAQLQGRTSRLQAQETSNPPSTQSSPQPPKFPAAIKVEPSYADSISTNPEARETTCVDSEISVPVDHPNLLTKLNEILQHLMNEKAQDKVLPERTRVPEDQAEALSKHSALWPPPKRELQKHMRAVPNFEPRDDGTCTWRYPEDFEPFHSTIETSTQKSTDLKQKRKQKTADNQPEAPAAREQHVFTLTNQTVQEEDSDEPKIEWAATPLSQLKDPFDRENEVFENSDADSFLDADPPPESSMPTPVASEYERTPRKAQKGIGKISTPVSALRRAVVEKSTPPKRRVVGVPMRPSSPVEGDSSVAVKQEELPATATQGNDSDTMAAEEAGAVVGERPRDGEDIQDEGEVEYYEDADEEDEGEEEESEGEEENEVQVCQTQSSPYRQHKALRQETPTTHDLHMTPRVLASSPFESPRTPPRSSPGISKRKADEISISPAKAGSAVSPMIRGPKHIKLEEAAKIGETIVKRAKAAIASSKEAVRQDLNISQADLANRTPGDIRELMAQLEMQRDAHFNGPSSDDSSD
ncbi:hypothetical protein TWF730_009955 [Orbilia blumenaviensis]|uniref:Uncharacterized protein n=1 Tax=Orbilia blumenaviensis TaxID=1796055 RepID=A0AAV9UVS2_9PEZI